MARVVTYTFIFIGMLAMMALAGLPTSTSQILTMVGYGNFSSFTGLNFFTTISAIFVLFAATSILVGLFTRQSTESLAVAGLSGSLLSWFITDMLSIYNYFDSICGTGSDCVFVSKIVLVLMAMMAGGFLISIVQWWRGNDI